MKTKTKVTISIDAELHKDFKSLAKKNCINMSAWFESKIQEYVKGSGKNEKSK